MSSSPQKMLGVVVVTYASADVITECIESLFRSQNAPLKIVVCDNASPDETCSLVRETAARLGCGFTETTPEEYRSQPALSAPEMTLIHAGGNTGFAGGVNKGIEYLMKDADVGFFWVLNPDCIVQEGTAAAYLGRALDAGEFGLLGGRTVYADQSGMIQSDGGKVNRFTGICSNVHYTLKAATTPMPGPDELDYLSGANFVVSRRFVQDVGPMHEDYFLYYEEVDWALRRGGLPIILSDEAIVLHHAGTAIGSGTKNRAYSAFANYFMFRARMMFMRRMHPWALPVAYVYSLLKIGQIMLKGFPREARGAWRGLMRLSPPPEVLDRLDESARKHLLG